MPTRTFHWMMGVAILLFAATDAGAQIGGKAGAFSRMGFGARGMGMGNAMTAVTSGELAGYYNPAALTFAEGRTASAAFGILALDRRLNFLQYAQPVRPSAGIAFGIINAGVSDIDGRDRDGEQTGALTTSENLAYLSFANRFSPRVNLGITIKMYYHHLYTDVSVLSVGFDFGALIPVSEDVTIGATVRDINSKYQWDTGELYGDQSGRKTIDKFPLLYTGGGAWRLPDSLGTVSADIEASNQSTLLLRAGAEIPIIPEFSVRVGIDRIDMKDKGMGIRPTFGFSVRRSFGTWVPALQYAYVHEPFVSPGMHVISLAVTL
jgi:hypothetical protein